MSRIDTQQAIEKMQRARRDLVPWVAGCEGTLQILFVLGALILVADCPREATREKRKVHNAHGPDVNGLEVPVGLGSRLHSEHLGGHVRDRASGRGCAVGCAGRSKVNQLEVAVVIAHAVLGLDVAVHLLMRMDKSIRTKLVGKRPKSELRSLYTDMKL